MTHPPEPLRPATDRTVLVLGANGRIGRAATLAFAEAGWQVRAQMRQAPRGPLPAGVQAVQADALDLATLQGAAHGAGLILNALSPDYTRWDALWPPLAEASVALARHSGARLMLPGNVYVFGRQLPERLHERTPFVADHPKAAQRIALERRLADAATLGVRSVVLRAGDFLGDHGTWLDMAMARRLTRGRFVQMGPDNLVHAWAWLPDLARTMVAVAERLRAQPDALSAHAVLHHAGLALTGAQLQAGLAQALGRPLRAGRFPWPLLQLARPLSPMVRALFEMRHLWQRPHRLDGSRLRSFLGGAVPETPVDQVLAGCLQVLGAAPVAAPRARQASAASPAASSAAGAGSGTGTATG